MLARSFVYIAVATLAITSFSACGRQDKAPEAAEEQAAQAPPAEDSGVPIGEAAMTAQIRSITRTLRQAGWHAKRNNSEGVLLFSDVATLLTKRAAVASNAVKEDLQFSASELTGLGERIYSGPPITPKELDVVRTHTYWALAAFHQEQAATLWQDGNAQETTVHLVASADFVGYARGAKRKAVEDLAKRTKELAQQLKGETVPDSDNVSRQIQEIGQEIRKLNNRVKQFLS